MATNTKRQKFPRIILVLSGLIVLIFLIDFVWRNMLSPVLTDNDKNMDSIIAEGDFNTSDTLEPATTATTEATTESTTDDHEKATDTTETTEETTEDKNANKQVITLENSDIHNGPLVMVSGTCPYVGSQNFVDFSSVSDYNVIPRDYNMTFQSEMKDAICNLFDAYSYANGYVNLQIYSTSEIYSGADSLYTTVLSERSSGYTFDIGLITSTGEVVAYLTKRNEWMFGNCWQYGFIVRYSDMKTGTTGVGFMPHHFRYVGLPHSMLMNDYDLCLEEYLQFLTSYTLDNPLTCTYFGTTYEIFYVPADASGKTEVAIPKNVNYTVSGNNTDGYIFTLVSNGEPADPVEPETEDETNTAISDEPDTAELTDADVPESVDAETISGEVTSAE